MTVLASNNPLPDPPVRPGAAFEPVRLGNTKPLFALTQDAQLIAALKKVTAPAHEVLSASAEIDLSTVLVTHHAGVAVIDCAALTTEVATLTGHLHEQFPEVVLIVAGTVAEQSQLAARITDGVVYRFLHKPFSEQRVRLFVEAAWRRHAQLDAEPRSSQPPRTVRRAAGFNRALALAVFAVSAVLAALGAAFLWFNGRTAAPPTRRTAAAATTAPAAAAAEMRAGAAQPEAQSVRPRESLTPGAGHLLEQADAALQAHHPDDAQRALDEARALSPGEPRLASLESALAAERSRATAGRPQEKQPDARLIDYLGRARDALARGALISPAEDNARLYVESAHAISPDDPAVLDAQSELRARLESAAHQALESADPDAAEKLAVAAGELGADPARVSALHEDAQQLRGRVQSEALGRLLSTFNERLGQGQLLEPAADCAKSYLAQLLQQDADAVATRQARSAWDARVLGEARLSLKAQDFPSAQRWLAEARSAGADAAEVSALEGDVAAAQAAAAQAASFVTESTLTRTRYVAPKFPDTARARGIDGWVDLQFLVGTDGTVSEVTVVGAQPAGVFEAAAVDAVQRWRYQPVTHGGQSLAQHTRVRVRFQVQR